jgi:hypothetical protein
MGACHVGSDNGRGPSLQKLVTTRLVEGKNKDNRQISDATCKTRQNDKTKRMTRQ